MRSNTFNDPHYYQYLNIDRNAIPEVVSAAYRGLMKKYHPDSNAGNKENEEKAKKLNEAYEVLSDPIKRKEYDKWLDSHGKGSADNSYSRQTKQGKTDAGSNSSGGTNSSERYEINFDYIRTQVFKGYDTWYSAKREAQKREEEKKNRTKKRLVILTCIVAIGGFGYIYRDQLPFWKQSISKIHLHGNEEDRSKLKRSDGETTIETSEQTFDNIKTTEGVTEVIEAASNNDNMDLGGDSFYAQYQDSFEIAENLLKSMIEEEQQVDVSENYIPQSEYSSEDMFENMSETGMNSEDDEISDIQETDSSGNSTIQTESAELLYIFPESDSRQLTEADLDGLTMEMIWKGKNEIYARHGRMFNDPDLQAYFNQQPWYTGTIEGSAFDNSIFNEFEHYNAESFLDKICLHRPEDLAQIYHAP